MILTTQQAMLNMDLISVLVISFQKKVNSNFHLFIEPGLNFAYRGFNQDYTFATVNIANQKAQLGYLEVPVNLGFHFKILNKHTVSVFAEPSYSFGLMGNDSWSPGTGSRSVKWGNDNFEFRKSMIGINYGARFQLKNGLTFGIKRYNGLGTAFQVNNNKYKMYTTGLTIGYIINQ